MRKIHLAGLASLAGWAALAWASHVIDRPLWVFLAIQAWQWAVWLWAFQLTNRPRPLAFTWGLVGWAIAFRLCGGFATPLMEDDHFRFLWDGYQFAASGNPYAAAPADFFQDPDVPEKYQPILDQINYPHVPTIYGPTCQILFWVSHALGPAQLWPWKLILILFDLGMILLGLALTGQRATDETKNSTGAARTALILGWAPLMVFETSFNAHPDIIGVVLLSVALLFHHRRWPIALGLALGLSTGAKVFALLLVPFLLRGSVRGWLAFAITLLGLYLPFWLQGGGADVSGLLAFSQGWEFNSSLFALLQWLLDPDQARWTCGLIFALAWCAILLRATAGHAEEHRPEFPPGLLVFGLFFLLSPTVNPWYLLWLAPFIVRWNSWTALAAWALVSLSYVTGLNLGDPALTNFQHPVWVRPLEYGLLGLISLFEFRKKRMRGEP